jgi:uncharacterized protein YlzI (FlbEa/FlbD family)
LFWYIVKEWVQEVVEIDMLKAQSTLKSQSKYKCPCCEKLWGNKFKLNWHFLATPCPRVKVINGHKFWLIVVRAISCTTSTLGATSS